MSVTDSFKSYLVFNPNPSDANKYLGDIGACELGLERLCSV